jgi:cation transporter-like permease
MEPPSYMRSVVDRNVVMPRITVLSEVIAGKCLSSYLHELLNLPTLDV